MVQLTAIAFKGVWAGPTGKIWTPSLPPYLFVSDPSLIFFIPISSESKLGVFIIFVSDPPLHNFGSDLPLPYC